MSFTVKLKCVNWHVVCHFHLTVVLTVRGKRKAVEHFLPPIPVDNEPPHPTKRGAQLIFSMSDCTDLREIS